MTAAEGGERVWEANSITDSNAAIFASFWSAAGARGASGDGYSNLLGDLL